MTGIQKGDCRRFLVLVPHRDVRGELRKYSKTLFESGFARAYQFPWVMPLAEISCGFNGEELRQFAKKLREVLRDGKFEAKGAGTVTLAIGAEKIFGPRIEFLVSEELIGFSKKVTSVFSPLIVGSCLQPVNESEDSAPPPPQVSFRAAAVANMCWRSVKSGGVVIGYRWKIGKLYWLPKKIILTTNHH